MLLGYVITLAPTVTLWDAGEFITAAKVLGIPHPPGTPLFVLVSHVWGEVFAVGGYAWRLNLMSACFAAAGAGCLFLVAHRLLVAEVAWLRVGGAAAAAILSAFTFTGWQNSNETEVYTLATFSIAAICWLCLLWRDRRGTPRATHILLLIVYIAALSIGNHLLALLVGPAVSLFLAYTLRAQPAADPHERRMEWAEWAALTTLWIVLIAVGLGSSVLLVAGGVLFGAAVVACVMAGSRGFPVLAIAIAAVGISTYAFLYIRSGLQPLLDEADPETWKNLLAVIRREQFGSRGLLDNPTMLPGDGIRTPLLIGQQFVNYFQYCSWQWGRSLPFAGMVAVALLFVTLGIFGFEFARRRDVGFAYLLGTLWLITGAGLVLYMNFKPGFSLFWNQYTTMSQHEVRERDYFFVASFQVWGLFAGLSLVRFLSWLLSRAASPAHVRAGIAAAVLVTVFPFAGNFTAASRRHGPDATAARDVAYNLLQSVEPYGVLFGFGDNDTFPVWYLQEVEGVRQDVTQINLSLANLDWYLRQLASRTARPFDPARAPALYRSLAPPQPPRGAVLPLPKAVIDSLQPIRFDENRAFRSGALELPIRQGTVFRVADQAILFAIATYLPSRPVTFGVSSGHGSWLGLDPYLLYQGLVFSVVPNAERLRRGIPGIQGTMVDTARTRLLVDSVFQYGKLFTADSLALEPAAQQVATSFSIPFLELANAAAQRGDPREVLTRLRQAYHLNPSRALADAIRRVEAEGVQSLFRP
ncbi:MAG: glycosyltransferase family 117 protein [Gemmatimonadales bacterium]